jgi:predicted dehydrogenase
MADDTYGFALIGCGRIASRHAECLSGPVIGGRLVAVCDVEPAAAKEFGERYKVPYFTDMHAMMAAVGPQIDVVCLLTESGYHARDCLQVVRYRKHIIVEKPMALTLEDADSMIQACDAAGVRLMVVKQNRFNLPVRKLKEAIDQGRFGKMVMGTVRVRWCRTQAYYDQAPWRGTWALDGGVFSNQASHHIDLLQWCMGDPETVYAKTATRLVKIEAEDTGVAVIRFRSGALGIIEATTGTRPKDLEGSISILGEKGSVEIAGFAVNQMRTWNFNEEQPGDREVLEKYRENPPNVYGFGHLSYLNNVVSTLRNNAGALVDGLEGRKSLELISAIYESAETGREVPLRFRPQHGRLGSR